MTTKPTMPPEYATLLRRHAELTEHKERVGFLPWSLRVEYKQISAKLEQLELAFGKGQKREVRGG